MKKFPRVLLGAEISLNFSKNPKGFYIKNFFVPNFHKIHNFKSLWVWDLTWGHRRGSSKGVTGGGHRRGAPEGGTGGGHRRGAPEGGAKGSPNNWVITREENLFESY